MGPGPNPSAQVMGSCNLTLLPILVGAYSLGPLSLGPQARPGCAGPGLGPGPQVIVKKNSKKKPAKKTWHFQNYLQANQLIALHT